MIGNAYLPAADCIFFDDGTSGNAGQGGDDNIFADDDVVADVHQIIDLDAATDHGGIERSPINGSVGADLHVVANLQAADLRKGLVAAGLLVAHVAEAGAAQHRPGVHRHPVAQAGKIGRAHV